MTEEELATAITVVRNKFQSRISIAKSFLTPEQKRVFLSKPFRAERNDKPRWDYKAEDARARARYAKRTGNADGWLPLHRKWALGRPDYLHHTRVTLAQIARILSGDHTPRVRAVPARRGYVYKEQHHIVI